MRALGCFFAFLLCAGCALNGQSRALTPSLIAEPADSERLIIDHERRERAATERAASEPAATPPAVASEGAPDSSDTHAAAASIAEADRALCVNEVNRFRRLAGREALVRSPGLETFASEAARADHLARAPHRHFRRVPAHEPRAENEIPWWPLESFRSVGDVIQQGIAMFWDEGPGGGHYQNMLGPWREAGCGGFISGRLITVAVEFR